MSIPQTNFDPPFNITRASHMVFTARDLGRSRAFYTEVLGLIVSDEDKDTLWLRGVEEQAHHSLTLHRTAGPAQCVRVSVARRADAAAVLDEPNARPLCDALASPAPDGMTYVAVSVPDGIARVRSDIRGDAA